MRNYSISRKTGLLIICVFMLFSFNHCVEDDNNLPSTAGWSSLDPTSIPLRQRMIQANRDNLVKNPSFEQGRIINIDSNTISNNITGWKWVGENVDWVLKLDEGGNTGSEVHSGIHAVIIQRDNADETIGQGEGIISDFIRIIPGNYEFTFWIRLKEIHSYQERHGSRIDDAIDIRVLFYDKNRLLISGKTYNPQRNAGIDQSFKALPFAGFWNIDSLGWSLVRGRTTNDYLTEGDVPDEAKFVKIFFGLKGTGTMWIDDVDFRYSSSNFTSLEKSERFFDTTFTAIDLLVPTPKKALALDPFTYHYPGSDSLPSPVILIPQHSSRQTYAAALLLKTRLDTLFRRHYGKEHKSRILITSNISDKHIQSGGLIFSLGKNHLSGRRGMGFYLKELQGQEQGYVIQPDSLAPNLVHLLGNSSEGDYYAAVTAIQLLDKSHFIYRQSRITDYPDIPERSFLISPVAASSDNPEHADDLADMINLKLNHGYLDYYRSRTMWDRTSTAYLRGLAEIGRKNGKHGMIQLAQMVNPYAFLPVGARLDSLEMRSRNRWIHASSSSLSKLYMRFQAGIEAGASTLVLCANDHLPYDGGHPLNYSLYADRDRNTYINLQEAHLELINSIINTEGFDRSVKLEFIPPWYANEMVDQSRGQGEQYLRDLSGKLPDNITMLWSGPSPRSYSVDEADYHRFKELVGRELVLWDNSLNTIPEILGDTSLSMSLSLKLRTLNILEPYQVKITNPSIFGERAGKILINSPLDTELMKIRVATAADFLWNTRTYNPDLSLWKVLVSGYGTEAAMNLYHFNESYMVVLGSIAALRNDSGNQRHARQIKDQLEIMQETLETLEKQIPHNPRLINELRSLKMNLERRFEKDVKAVSTQVMAVIDSI